MERSVFTSHLSISKDNLQIIRKEIENFAFDKLRPKPYVCHLKVTGPSRAVGNMSDDQKHSPFPSTCTLI